MSNRRNTHWCYRCRRPVRLRGPDAVCSNCEGGFVQDIDEMDGIGPLDFLGLDSDDEHDPRFGIMEAFSALMSQRLSGRNRELDIRGRSALIPEHGTGISSSPWLIFRGQIPVRMSENGGIEVLLNGGGLRRGNVGDFFVGAGLDELIEQLTVNDHRGPPPAARSAIDAMPTVKISQEHLRTNSHCAVCKDMFELGSETRLMPCNHMYHADCIIPWLVQHNSCPVCRLELPPQASPSSRSNNQNSPRGSTSTTSNTNGENQGRRNPFSFLWPFRSSNSNTNSSTNHSESGESRGDNNQTRNSGWPFDLG
ncbi:hypothetical protein GIB67_017002 [Kingdonia uniflora]|uniref:RING-type E3 ubiquitin transferase n=1 Tax=Kingdonia uniflora TaxID=39325 RepID=A0A7J7M3T9_9MAGN|nr:hypothetical protein GIB67_017002 [Kingdonia uniflora]